MVMQSSTSKRESKAPQKRGFGVPSLLRNLNTYPMETSVKDLKEQLGQFHGSQCIYSLPICRTLYTEGIQYLAETANAFWLLTDVSVMGKSLMDKSRFITVDFKRYSETEREEIGFDAVITYGDGNGTVFTEQKYHITDFPMDALKLYFVDNTLLLPSEY